MNTRRISRIAPIAIALALLVGASRARADEAVEALAARVVERARERLGEGASARVAEAVRFARAAHEGQVRDGGEPFVIHVLRVADRTLGSPHPVTAEMVQAAVLHDTVEDTETRIEDIRRRFGDRVARHVHDLTLDPVEAFGGDKEARDRAYYERFAEALRGSQVIKLSDRLDNVNDMRAWPLEGRLGYLAKTRRVLIPALARHSPDLARALEAEVVRIEGAAHAEWERVARLTLPELVARARQAGAEGRLPLDRVALVSLITGTEKPEVERRWEQIRSRPRPASPRSGRTARGRARGFVEQMREQVRTRSGRGRGRSARR